MTNDTNISSETKDILDRLKNVINDSNTPFEIIKPDQDNVLDLTEQVEEDNDEEEPSVKHDHIDHDVFDHAISNEDQSIEDQEIITETPPPPFNPIFDESDDEIVTMESDIFSNEDTHKEIFPNENNPALTSFNDMVVAKNENLNAQDTDSKEIFDTTHNDISNQVTEADSNKDINEVFSVYDDDFISPISPKSEIDFLSEYDAHIDNPEETAEDSYYDDQDNDIIPEGKKNWEDAVKSELDNVDSISMHDLEPDNIDIIEDGLIEKAVESAKYKLQSHNSNEAAAMRLPKNKYPDDSDFNNKSYDLDRFIDSGSEHDLDPDIDFNSINENLTQNEEANLVSNSTKNATQELFSEFQSSYNNQDNTESSQSSNPLESIVKEMLRPCLKEWMDQNLTEIVERIVKQELDKIKK